MISVLIVNWNGTRYLADCLQSIEDTITSEFEVIVVDNGSSDGSPELVAAKFPWVKLIRSSQNLGFGRGNNLAAQHATGETLLLLNYDTVLIADPSPIASALLNDKSIGCVGAKMCNGTGDEVANCGHFPSPLRVLLFTSIFWRPYQRDLDFAATGAKLVDWVEGSWALIRRNTWNQVNGFDERIFMYGEDVDLCRRIKDKSLNIVQIPTVAYRHYTGWSVNRLPFQFAGFRLYHRKHSRTIERMMAEAVLLLGLHVRLICYWTLGFVTRQARYKEKTSALRNVGRQWKQLGEPGYGML